MRKVFIPILIILLNAAYADAQRIKQKNVPSIVVNALQLKFPKATEADWELVRGNYKARFEMDDIDHEVWLDYSGRLKKHMRDFDENDLPKAVKSAIQKSFGGFEVHNVERMEEGKKVHYKMKLEKSPSSFQVVFDEEGRIVKKKEN